MTRNAMTGALLLLALATPAVATAKRDDAADKDTAKQAEAAKAKAAAAEREQAKGGETADGRHDRADEQHKRDDKPDKSRDKAREREREETRDGTKARAERKARNEADRKKRDRDLQREKTLNTPETPGRAPDSPATPEPVPPPPAPPPPVLPPSQSLAVSNRTMPMPISAWVAAGAPDPGKAVGEALLVSFDVPSVAGVTSSSSGQVITAAGSIGGVRAAPAGNGGVYQSLGANSQSQFDFSGWSQGQPLSSLSFEWGSIDSYNFVDFLNRRGETVWTLAGSDLPQFNGDQQAAITNQRLFVRFQREADITGVRMRSTGAAFEFDSIAGSSWNGAVPEPESWALLITGFAAIGVAMRRRQRVVAA